MRIHFHYHRRRPDSLEILLHIHGTSSSRPLARQHGVHKQENPWADQHASEHISRASISTMTPSITTATIIGAQALQLK
jgi:hypothetical protein